MMEGKAKSPSNYSYLKGESIFEKGHKTDSVNILLKGKVDMYLKDHRVFSVDENIFIGTTDWFLDKTYSYQYTAAEDGTSLYSIPIHDLKQLEELLHSQKEYAAYTITSISTMMLHIAAALFKLENKMMRIRLLANNLSILFWQIRDEYNLTHMPSTLFLHEAKDKYHELKGLGRIPDTFKEDFLKEETEGYWDLEYSFISDEIKKKLEYYKHILAIPIDVRKDFFSADDVIAFHHFCDAAQNIHELNSNLLEVIELIKKYLKTIYSKDDGCITYELLCLVKEAMRYDQDCQDLFLILDTFIEGIDEISYDYQNEYNVDLKIDIGQLKTSIQQIKQAEKVELEDLQSNDGSGSEDILDELKDSAEKIIRFSGISNEKADALRSCLEDFRKGNYDGKLKKKITPLFFEVYEMVLKRVIDEDNRSRLFEMFLVYGFMDERLLTKDQNITLYKLCDTSKAENPCEVYNMKEWLQEIYSLKKVPSVNEFDQDYFDVFRDMKKKGEVNESQKNAYSQDRNGRLDFEINNMFMTNHKLCYGQSSTYFPILHSEMILKDLSKALVTRDKVAEIINKILDIDFTAFHREIIFHDSKMEIEKELISKSVAPDIILVPTFGFRGLMWQNIAGRDRSTPGRFLLPIFTSEDLEDMLIKIIGNFRFELCRTMMGMSWNDITINSLTSEYTDYIQFYRKNRDLSEEAREKVKLQIQRNSNRVKDIFTSDYEIWVKYESKGNLRLNKVARGILYKHCPFSKPIREALKRSPIFNELETPFSNIRNKYARELENRYNKLLNRNISAVPELEENLKLFKEL